MRRLKLKSKTKKGTIYKQIAFVFFLAFILAFFLFNHYAKKMNKDIIVLVNAKTDKIIYKFFSDLITDEIINKNNINDLLVITKNSKGEILTVNYDLEKTYAILTLVSKVLEDAIDNLEKGQISVNIDDQFIKASSKGLILEIPLFLNSKNIFLNNLGPKIPVLLSFNENLLTNIKTKVTNYGLNNALLEIYITVEMQKLIIAPLEKNQEKFNYDILIASLVINGSVPNIYDGIYESGSNILSPF